MRYRNSVEFEVTGEYGLFADPVTRVGGEKFTFQIPTYEAIKGILQSIHICRKKYAGDWFHMCRRYCLQDTCEEILTVIHRFYGSERVCLY